MKSKTENYLVALRETIYRSQEKIRDGRIDQQLEAIDELISQYENTENAKIHQQLTISAHIVAKEFQLVLIDLMTSNFKELLVEEDIDSKAQQASKEKKPEEQSFFNKFLGGVEDALSSLSKSKFALEATAFIANVEKTKKSLLQAAPGQIINLVDLNNSIDSYSKILEMKNGYIPRAEGMTEPTQSIKPRKAKRSMVEITESNSKIYTELKRQADNLGEELEFKETFIRNTIAEHQQRASQLKEKFAKDPMITEQLDLLNGIIDTSVPDLAMRKTQTIDETNFLLRARYFPADTPMSKEEAKKHGERWQALENKYLKEYGTLTKEKLYEILVRQSNDYILQLTYVANKIDTTARLITAKVEEIEEQNISASAIETREVARVNSKEDSSNGQILDVQEEQAEVPGSPVTPKVGALKSELQHLSDDYNAAVMAIGALARGFNNEKLPLVQDVAEIKELLGQYNKLLQEKDQVISQRKILVDALNHPDVHHDPEFALERPRVEKQIESTREAITALRRINTSLTTLLAEKLNPAIQTAEKKRVEDSETAIINIKLKVEKLRGLVRTVEDSQFLGKYVTIDEGMKQVLENAVTTIEKLPGFTAQEIADKSSEAQKKIDDIARPLNTKIERASEFWAKKATLHSQLDQLEQARQAEPLSLIYGKNISDLRAIREDLNTYDQNYKSILWQELAANMNDLNNKVKNIQAKHGSMSDAFVKRSQSEEIKCIDKLIGEAKSQNLPWTQTLANDLDNIKLSYLKSEIGDLAKLKALSAETLATHVTEDNLAMLTNNDESATTAGNFFRALAELIIAIGYTIGQKAKEPYRVQFFASKTEIDFANQVRHTHNNLKQVADLLPIGTPPPVSTPS